EISDPVTSLIKKIDAATTENRSAKIGSFVVFLSEDDSLQDALRSLADKGGIRNTPLAVDVPAGPKDYKLAKEADVTVVLYVRQEVVSSFAYRTGELNASAIDAIIADVPKMLSVNRE